MRISDWSSDVCSSDRMSAAADAAPILVVDDDPKIVALVRTYLERERFPVVTATDGRTALRLIEERSPRLVVLDLMIPELDGLTGLGRASCRERGWQTG